MPEEYVTEIVGGEPEKVETPSSVEAPSEENPVEGELPKEEEPAGETPAPELYELPDGRKATGAEVLEEYRNLQKDYTQKSQKLSNYEKQITSKENVPEYKNPDWQPQTYSEIIEAAKAEIIREFEETRKADEAFEQQLSEQVESQLAEVKSLDPKVNENKLLEHATKYNIPNLVSAYKNMKEMTTMVETVRQETAKNLAKRASDPVAGGSGQEVPVDMTDVYDPSVTRGSLLEALRQIKKTQ